MTPQGAWIMSFVGLLLILLLGFILARILPWTFRSIGESLTEFRRNPEDSDTNQ